MGLIATVKSWAGAVRFPGKGGRRGGATDGRDAARWLRRLMPGSRFDYEAQAGDLWMNGAVAICLAWLVRNFPEPRPCVRERKRGGAEIENHPLVALVERPNPHYEAEALWAGVITGLVVDGNSYLVKGATLAGETAAFYYVPYWQIEPTWPADGTTFIDGFDFTVDGRTTRLRTEQVVHFRVGMDPENTRKGLSPLKAQLREVCTDNEAATFTAATLRNMGVPGFSIAPDDKDAVIEKEDRDAIKKTWREEFTGEGRGGLLVSSLKVQLQKITLTPEELVLDKIRRVPEARIHGASGVNAQVTGQNVGESQKTYANYGEARRAAYHDALVPLQKTIGRQLSSQCPELIDPAHVLTWDYADVEAMQEDATAKASRAAALFRAGIATRNEARSMINLGPSVDGDDFRGAPRPPLPDDAKGPDDDEPGPRANT